MAIATPESSVTGSRSGVVRVPLVVAALCAVVYLLTAAYTSVSGDVMSANVLSWQLATTGDAEFTESTYPPIDEHPARAVWVIPTEDGREVIGRSPGAVALALPAYLARGDDSFSLAPAAVSAAVLTAVAILLLGLALRDLLPAKEVALAMLVVGLGTPMWSVAADGMWPHTVTVLGICGMAWSARRERWWLVGLFGGVVVWGRLHAAVIVAIVGLYVAWKRRDAATAIRVGTVSGLMLAVQCVWTQAVYGSWNPMSSYDTGPFEEYAGDHRLDLVNQLGFWVSPDRGILIWTPLIVVLIPALVRSWRSLPDWSRGLAIGALAYTLLQGFLNRFSGGDSFYGYRLTLELLACRAPALALSASRAGRVARLCFAPVLTIQVLVIATGAIVSGLGTRAEDVWTRNSFFSPLATEPAALVSFVLVSLLVGVLAGRIWADPHVSAPKRQAQTFG